MLLLISLEAILHFFLNFFNHLREFSVSYLFLYEGSKNWRHVFLYRICFYMNEVKNWHCFSVLRTEDGSCYLYFHRES